MIVTHCNTNVSSLYNKSSAVAEMGDCLATIGISRKMGDAAVLLSVGELGPHLTQCRLGRGIPPYQVASWSIQPITIHQCYRQMVTIHQRHRQIGQTGQRSRSTGRTVSLLVTVAQKLDDVPSCDKISSAVNSFFCTEVPRSLAGAGLSTSLAIAPHVSLSVACASWLVCLS